VAKDEQPIELPTMLEQNKTLEEENSTLLDIQKLTGNHQEELEKKEEHFILFILMFL